MSEQFSNSEQVLIERLRRAPQPELPTEARAMIRAHILDALDHPPQLAPRPALLRAVVVVLVAAALIAGGIFFVVSQQTQPEITPTPIATLTIPPPTATPTLTITPTALPTTTIGVITVVEGPVDSVVDNVIMVYGTPVQVPTSDPILITVKVGDVVRIESNSQTGTSQVILIVTPTANNGGDVNTNPSSGEVWQDDGNCSHPPPDWAPANGWRRRCEGKDKGKDKDDKHNKDDD